jgi:CheY-like chemotaxis protein
LRILLVEDNLEISEVMTVYCGFRKDIDCKVVNSGQEGLERIRNENFDLILLDLAMPEFSGKQVIQSFTREQLVQKNVVIFTASSDPPVLEQMKNTGIKEIFKKPFSLEQLTELIEKYRPRQNKT